MTSTALARAHKARRGHNEQKRTEERIYVYKARITGRSIRAIAELASEHFGYPISPAKVHTLLTEETHARITPAREEYLAWADERLDNLLVAAHALIASGEPQSVAAGINAVLRVEAQRADLHGYKKAAQVEVSGQVTHTTQQDIELRQMLQEQAARNTAEQAALKAQP